MFMFQMQAYLFLKNAICFLVCFFKFWVKITLFKIIIKNTVSMWIKKIKNELLVGSITESRAYVTKHKGPRGPINGIT